MIGDVAQIITIASYGNEFLNNGLEKLDCRNHSSFRGKSDTVYINGFDDQLDTNQWYQYLKGQGCTQIRIFYNVVDPNKDGVLIHKSIKWSFESIYDGYSDYWTYFFHYGLNGWWAKIEKAESHQSIINKQDDLVLRKHDLNEKLKKMIEFSSQLAWGNWAGNFQYMRNILYSDSPTLPDFHKDLVVAKNYSLLARQLLYSAVSAWCFTGMGSWSDNGYFPEITRDLFFSVCDAYVASVNSY